MPHQQCFDTTSVFRCSLNLLGVDLSDDQIALANEHIATEVDKDCRRPLKSLRDVTIWTVAYAQTKDQGLNAELL